MNIHFGKLLKNSDEIINPFLVSLQVALKINAYSGLNTLLYALLKYKLYDK